jgi:hypothetical protein
VGALLCYAVLLGLFLGVVWTTGRGDVISVGGAGHQPFQGAEEG